MAMAASSKRGRVEEDDFDFEPHVKEHVFDKAKDLSAQQQATGKDGKPKWVIVCRFWLQGRCISGADECTYLHRLDKQKMPQCELGALCKIKNCQYQHVKTVQECLYYKQGFCIKGPDCKLKHLKLRPEERPEQANYDACAGGVVAPGGQMSAANQAKLRKSQTQNDNFKSTLCTHWLRNGSCHFNDDCHFAHGEDQINDINQGEEAADDPVVIDPTRMKLEVLQPTPPFGLDSKASYFMLQAPDLQSLYMSKQKGTWAVTVRMAAEINTAVAESKHVIAFMSVRSYRGVYGIVEITGRIPPAMSGSQITPEFPVKWIRTMRVGIRTVAQMKYNTGMFIGKTASDGRFKSDAGYDIMMICYRKEAWDWMNEDISELSAGVPDKEVVYAQPGGGALFGNDWIDRMASTTSAYVNAFQRNKNMLQQNAILSTVDRYGNIGVGGSDVPNDYYNGEFGGFVFMAQDMQIVREMVTRKLFGVPSVMMNDVIVHPGAPLFLYDNSQKMLYGMFMADSPVSQNIDPRAFCPYPGAPSALPIQLRVTVAHECRPCPINDPGLQKVFNNRISLGAIDLELTKALANFFARRAGLQVGGPGGVTMGMVRDQRLRRSGAPEPGMVTSMYKPPYKFVEEVAIDVVGDLFQIKRMLLGNKASAVREVIQSLGDEQCIKIRMRGIGSGYPEGIEARELQEPLHFNICAETEQLLQAVVAQMKANVEKARKALSR